jgi:hypothetical protein
MQKRKKRCEKAPGEPIVNNDAKQDARKGWLQRADSILLTRSQ